MLHLLFPDFITNDHDLFFLLLVDLYFIKSGINCNIYL